MRPIISIFTAIITITLLNAQAFAVTATWAEGPGWNIKADSSVPLCHLIVDYETEDFVSLIVGDRAQGPAMGLYGRNLRPLVSDVEIVEASVRFSSGDSYRLIAKVLGPNLIMADIPKQLIVNFAETLWMEVRVRGLLVDRYNLDGTKGLVIELASCLNAMRGQPS